MAKGTVNQYGECPRLQPLKSRDGESKFYNNDGLAVIGTEGGQQLHKDDDDVVKMDRSATAG